MDIKRVPSWNRLPVRPRKCSDNSAIIKRRRAATRTRSEGSGDSHQASIKHGTDTVRVMSLCGRTRGPMSVGITDLPEMWEACC